MDAAIKARWVEALRSGEYDQAQGVLVALDKESMEPVGFCCLGVLCDLAEKDGVVTSRTFRPNDLSPVRQYGTEGEYALLPTQVQEWAGIQARSPQVSVPLPEDADEEDHLDFPEGFRAEDLAEINDQGASFEQIADLIEAQL